MTEQHELDRMQDDGCPHEGAEEPRYGPSPVAGAWPPWSNHQMMVEEHAAHITQGWRAIELAVEYTGVPASISRPDSVYVGNAVPWAREIIAASIRAAVEQAVAKEREACARLAEIAIYNGGNYPGLHREGMSDAATRIAAAIRARKGTT